jgi:hypothetical protein
MGDYGDNQETRPAVNGGLPRRIAGVAVAAVVVTTAVLFVLGSWNPWRLVLLREYFNNPWLGLILVGVGAYLAMWLLAPVRSEAVQRWRIPARVTAAVAASIGLIIGGITHQFYYYEHAELARSDDGEVALARVTFGGRQTSELRLWEGSGLATREVATLGRACHGLRVRFVDRHLIEINQGFGDWLVELDPESGLPRQVLGPSCPDGPTPARLDG